MPGNIFGYDSFDQAQRHWLTERLEKLKKDAEHWAQKGIDPPIRNDVGSSWQTFKDFVGPDQAAHGFRVGAEKVVLHGPSARKVASTLATTGTGVGVGYGLSVAATAVIGVATATAVATGIGAAIALGLAITVGGGLYLYTRYQKRQEGEEKEGNARTDGERLDAFRLLLEHGRLDYLAHAFEKAFGAREKYKKEETDRLWHIKKAVPSTLNCVDVVMMAYRLCYWRKRLLERLADGDDKVCLGNALLIVQHRVKEIEAALEAKGQELVATCHGSHGAFLAAVPVELHADRAAKALGTVTPPDDALEWGRFLNALNIRGTDSTAKVLNVLILRARSESTCLPALPHFDQARKALAKEEAANSTGLRPHNYPIRSAEAARIPLTSGVARGVAGKIFTTLATKGVVTKVWLGTHAAVSVGTGAVVGGVGGLVGAFLGPVFDMIGNHLNDKANAHYLSSTETTSATAGEKVRRLRTMLTTGRLGKMHAAYKEAGKLLEKISSPEWKTENPYDAVAHLYQLQDHYMTILAAAVLIEEMLLIIENQTDRMYKEYNAENLGFWPTAERQNGTDVHRQCKGTCYGPKPDAYGRDCKHPLGA